MATLNESRTRYIALICKCERRGKVKEMEGNDHIGEKTLNNELQAHNRYICIWCNIYWRTHKHHVPAHSNTQTHIECVENCISSEIDAKFEHHHTLVHHQHCTIEFHPILARSENMCACLYFGLSARGRTHTQTKAVHHLQAFNRVLAAQTCQMYEHMLIY